jgi:hypothetical protein
MRKVTLPRGPRFPATGGTYTTHMPKLTGQDKGGISRRSPKAGKVSRKK